MSAARHEAPRFSVAGKRIVATGASSGIGRQIALDLGRGEARLVLVGRDEGRLGAVAEAVREGGGEAQAVVADILDVAGREAIVEAAASHLGRVDVLVHSAGVYRRAPLRETTSELLDFHLDVNLRAPYLLTRSFLDLLEEDASVVFISSMAAVAGIPNTSAYAASKSAIEAVTRVLAAELAPRRIRVNAVAPGFTATPMNAELREDPSVLDRALAATPMGRLSDPDDVAPAVQFLASDAAGFVCGATLQVTGGYPNAFAAHPSPSTRGESSPHE